MLKTSRFAAISVETQTSGFDSLEARNRANAQHSTGPRTDAGKKISSQNALKSGYSLTTHQILSNEDPEAYHQMLLDLQEIFAPQTDREHLAVLEISYCRWALRRLDLAEVAALNQFILAEEARSLPQSGDGYGKCTAAECIGYLAIGNCVGETVPEYKSLDLIHRYRRPWDRRHQEALKEFDRAVAARQRAERDAIRNAQEQIKLELLQGKVQTQAAKRFEGQLQHYLDITKARSRREAERAEAALIDVLTGFVPQYEDEDAIKHSETKAAAAHS